MVADIIVTLIMYVSFTLTKYVSFLTW